MGGAWSRAVGCPSAGREVYQRRWWRFLQYPGILFPSSTTTHTPFPPAQSLQSLERTADEERTARDHVDQGVL
ncbi:hypothetical protein chiPu_0013713 [Chiloscyllium punctatum]|uniref:Uncharacterized protein n=1 Tax=Chiloscyllium punctatum TaxID=137246 RepID=A0A401SXW9_CHIPU|nr:hypothetical protein [Chiloscyllium punctatum]